MLPRWHIFFGAIFTTIIWVIAPETKLFYLSLVFLSSFLIDFDHYLVVFTNTKKISLNNALKYYGNLSNQKSLKREKGHFYIFHTLEFHILILILSLTRIEFFYIFIGMIFHSFLDIYWMIKNDRIYSREFLLTNWLNKQFKQN
tara:strand:+ start:429 stop:860 length:432 start_codon:yes stop_codon:yes gene_type:complete